MHSLPLHDSVKIKCASTLDVVDGDFIGNESGSDRMCWLRSRTSLLVFDNFSGQKRASFHLADCCEILRVHTCLIRANNSALAEHLSTPKFGLYIATKELSDSAEACYKIYCFDIVSNKICSVIKIENKVTSLLSLRHNSAEFCHFPKSCSIISACPYLLLIGTEEGCLFLINPGWSASDSKSEAEPIEYRRVQDISDPGILFCVDLLQSFKVQSEFRWPMIASKPRKFPLNGVYVSALCKVPDANLLAVGFNFGSFLLISLHDFSFAYSPDLTFGAGAIKSFANQEPENDPRFTLYLWVMRDEKSVKSRKYESMKRDFEAELYQLYFGRRNRSKTGLIAYDDLQNCNFRFALPMENCSKVLFASGLALQPSLTDDASHAVDKSVACFIWSAGNVVKMALFDINGWYNAQMPRGVDLKNMPVRWDFLATRDLEFASSGFPSSALIALVHQHTVERFKPMLKYCSNSYFASLISLRATFLSDSCIINVQLDSLKKNAFDCLASLDLLSLSDVNSRNFTNSIIDSGLVDAKFYDHCSSLRDIHFVLFDLMFNEKNFVYFANFAARAKLTPESDSIGYYVDWIWTKLNELKDQLDEQMLLMSTDIDYQFDIKSIRDCYTTMNNLFHLFGDVSTGLDRFSAKREVIWLVKNYANLAFWFAEQRKIIRACAEHGDEFKNFSHNDMVAILIEKLDFSFQYPPESFFHLLSIYLRPDVNEYVKHFIVYFTLLSFNRVAENEAFIDWLVSFRKSILDNFDIDFSSQLGSISPSEGHLRLDMPNLSRIFEKMGVGMDDIGSNEEAFDLTRWQLLSLQRVHDKETSCGLTAFDRLGLDSCSVFPDSKAKDYESFPAEWKPWFNLRRLDFDYIYGPPAEKAHTDHAELIRRKIREILPKKNHTVDRRVTSVYRFPEIQVERGERHLMVGKSRFKPYPETPLTVKRRQIKRANPAVHSKVPISPSAKGNVLFNSFINDDQPLDESTLNAASGSLLYIRDFKIRYSNVKDLLKDEKIDRMLCSPLLNTSKRKLIGESIESIEKSPEKFDALPRKSILIGASVTKAATLKAKFDDVIASSGSEISCVATADSVSSSLLVKKFRFDDEVTAASKILNDSSLESVQSVSMEEQESNGGSSTSSASYEECEIFDDNVLSEATREQTRPPASNESFTEIKMTSSHSIPTENSVLFSGSATELVSDDNEETTVDSSKSPTTRVSRYHESLRRSPLKSYSPERLASLASTTLPTCHATNDALTSSRRKLWEPEKTRRAGVSPEKTGLSLSPISKLEKTGLSRSSMLKPDKTGLLRSPILKPEVANLSGSPPPILKLEKTDLSESSVLKSEKTGLSGSPPPILRPEKAALSRPPVLKPDKTGHSPSESEKSGPKARHGKSHGTGDSDTIKPVITGPPVTSSESSEIGETITSRRAVAGGMVLRSMTSSPEPTTPLKSANDVIAEARPPLLDADDDDDAVVRRMADKAFERMRYNLEVKGWMRESLESAKGRDHSAYVVKNDVGNKTIDPLVSSRVHSCVTSLPFQRSPDDDFEMTHDVQQIRSAIVSDPFVNRPDQADLLRPSIDRESGAAKDLNASSKSHRKNDESSMMSSMSHLGKDQSSSFNDSSDLGTSARSDVAVVGVDVSRWQSVLATTTRSDTFVRIEKLSDDVIVSLTSQSTISKVVDDVVASSTPQSARSKVADYVIASSRSESATSKVAHDVVALSTSKSARSKVVDEVIASSRSESARSKVAVDVIAAEPDASITDDVVGVSFASESTGVVDAKYELKKSKPLGDDVISRHTVGPTSDDVISELKTPGVVEKSPAEEPRRRSRGRPPGRRRPTTSNVAETPDRTLRSGHKMGSNNDTVGAETLFVFSPPHVIRTRADSRSSVADSTSSRKKRNSSGSESVKEVDLTDFVFSPPLTRSKAKVLSTPNKSAKFTSPIARPGQSSQTTPFAVKLRKRAIRRSTVRGVIKK